MARSPGRDESGAMDNSSTAADAGTDEHPPPAAPTGPRVTREEMKDLGRLRRSVVDRHVAGVAGGIARHLDIDPLIVRVCLVVATLFGGAGLIAYVGAWVLVPEEGTEDQPLGLDPRNRSFALIGIAVLALLSAIGDWASASWFGWPLAIVAAVVVWFVHRTQKTATPDAGPAGGYGSGYGYGYESPSYAAPGQAAPGYSQQYAAMPRQPRNPRRRGPVLFGSTMATICLAEGALGIIDLAGAPIASSAYPALALGIIAVMLVVGSFWGRAGGLISVGLVAAVATAAATAASSFPHDRLAFSPTGADDVRDTYSLGVGELVLDLSGISDVDGLDGREITVEGVGGRLEVIVPPGADLTVRTQAAAGDVRVFDQREDGFDVIVGGFLDGGDDVPDLTLDVEIAVGDIVVREAA